MQQLLSKFLVSSADFSKNLSGLLNFTGNGFSLFFLFFLLVIFLAALSFGKTRILLALLATYVAAFLESIFWYRLEMEKLMRSFLKLPPGFWVHLIVFVVFFILVFLILNRSVLKPKMSLHESPPVMILFLSVLLGVFWLSIVGGYLPADFSLVSKSIQKYLVLPSIKFTMAALPMVVLLFFKRKKSVLG